MLFWFSKIGQISRIFIVLYSNNQHWKNTKILKQKRKKKCQKRKEELSVQICGIIKLIEFIKTTKTQK